MKYQTDVENKELITLLQNSRTLSDRKNVELQEIINDHKVNIRELESQVYKFYIILTKYIIKKTLFGE